MGTVCPEMWQLLQPYQPYQEPIKFEFDGLLALLYAILAMVMLISLHWRGVSLEKTVNKSQKETCSNNCDMIESKSK